MTFLGILKNDFRPKSSLCSRIYIRNISYLLVFKLFSCLDFERKFPFFKVSYCLYIGRATKNICSHRGDARGQPGGECGFVCLLHLRFFEAILKKMSKNRCIYYLLRL